MESRFSRIEKMRTGLRDEYGPDSEGAIAEIDRALEAQMAKDPLLVLAGELFSRAHVALRHQRIAVARRLQSDGIAESRGALDLFLWDSRLVDHLAANLRHGEKLIEVRAFELKTNQRSFSRAELKRSCRQASEMNDQMFERNFTGDAEVHEAEARASYREQPAAPGRTGVSNSDWPRR